MSMRFAPCSPGLSSIPISARVRTDGETRRQQVRMAGGIPSSTRHLRRSVSMSGLLRDLHYALRRLRTRIGYTLIAVVSLGLGIGVNTAAFSLIDAILL